MLTLGDFLTVAEAAEYLGVCPNTIRNWGKVQKIPEHRHPLNNYRLYKRSDLDGVLRLIARPSNQSRKRTAK